MGVYPDARAMITNQSMVSHTCTALYNVLRQSMQAGSREAALK